MRTTLLCALLLIPTWLFSHEVNELFLGATLPLQAEGSEIKIGLEAAFSAANEQHALKDTHVELRAHEDKKNIAETVHAVNQFLEEQISIFVGIYMIGSIWRLLPSIEAGKLLVFGPDENSDRLYQSKYTHIIHTKAPLSREIEALVDYSIHELNKFKFAIFYEEGTLGVFGKKIAEDIIEKHAQQNNNPLIRVVATASHPDAIISINKAADDISAAFPDTIICIGSRHSTYNFVLEAINRGLMATTFLGTSYLMPLQKPLKLGRGIEFITTSLRPNAHDRHLPLARSYRRDLKAHFPHVRPSTISFDSYVHARIVLSVLEGIVGPITKDSIIDQAQSMTSPRSLEGLTIAFDPNTRSFLNKVWIAPGLNNDYIEWDPSQAHNS